VRLPYALSDVTRPQNVTSDPYCQCQSDDSIPRSSNLLAVTVTPVATAADVVFVVVRIIFVRVLERLMCSVHLTVVASLVAPTTSDLRPRETRTCDSTRLASTTTTTSGRTAILLIVSILSPHRYVVVRHATQWLNSATNLVRRRSATRSKST